MSVNLVGQSEPVLLEHADGLDELQRSSADNLHACPSAEPRRSRGGGALWRSTHTRTPCAPARPLTGPATCTQQPGDPKPEPTLDTANTGQRTCTCHWWVPNGSHWVGLMTLKVDHQNSILFSIFTINQGLGAETKWKRS